MPLFALLDEIADTLTLKHSIAVAGLVAVPIFGAARWYYNGLTKHFRKQITNQTSQIESNARDLEASRKIADQLRSDLEERSKSLTDEMARVARRDAAIEDAKKRLIPYYHAYQKLKPDHDRIARELAETNALLGKLTADMGDAGAKLKVLEVELLRRQQTLDRTERRVRAALRLDGRLWAAKSLQGVPKFRPLVDRRRAVISVINLKGGVGKTTITAHLGLALARRGYRVLLVDLDLQGSLTGLLLPADKHKSLSDEKVLLQDFFRAAAVDHRVKLTPYIQSVFKDEGSGGAVSLVGTSDHLAYAELSLTLGWLLRSGEKDARFLLRRATHRMGANAGFDIVLLDCPPLVNISCVNALAASDRVLIPVTPGIRAAERVPVLLGRFLKDEHFTKHVNRPEVLGIVANRTYGAQLTAAERVDWERLGKWCLDVYGSPAKQFNTIIPQQTKELRDAEAEISTPGPESRLSKTFAALAAEIEQELPHECRRGTATLS